MRYLERIPHRRALRLALFLATLLAPHPGGIARAQSGGVYGFPHTELQVADLDHDGWPDVVFSSPGVGRVSVLHGRGDGTFGPNLDLVPGAAPTEIAVGDLNGDGRMDLVVALTALSQAMVRLGRADGNYDAAPSVALPGAARTVALGDLDRDGRLDLVAGTESPRAVVRMIGNGDGTFGPPLHLFTPAHRPANLNIVNVGPDFFPDMIGLVVSDSMFVGIGNGAGGFSSITFTKLPFRPIYGSGNFRVRSAEPMRVWRWPSGVYAVWAFSPQPVDELYRLADVQTYYTGVINPGGSLSMQRFWTSFLNEPLMPVFDMGEITGDNQMDFFFGRGSTAIINTGSPPEYPGWFYSYDFPIPTTVVGITKADMNLDGIPDIVAVGGLRAYTKLNAGPWGGSTFGMGALPHTVTATAGPNGRIFPSGALATGALGTRKFVITPDPDYQVADVVVDGVSVGTPRVYTLPGIGADHTISVSFTGIPTPTLASLVEVESLVDRIRLTWHAAGDRGLVVTVYRRTGTGGWEPRGRISPDGSDLLVWEDADVVAGTRYGYRLGIVDGGVETFAGEVWATPASFALALHGVVPNPSPGGRLAVSFALPAAGPATLSLFDHGGRRVLERSVGVLGPGRHVVDLAVGRVLPPGVYLVRLRRGTEERVARAVVLR